MHHVLSEMYSHGIESEISFRCDFAHVIGLRIHILLLQINFCTQTVALRCLLLHRKSSELASEL
jgi:hypothetical protein